MDIRFLLDENLRGPLWHAIGSHNQHGAYLVDVVRVGDFPNLHQGATDPEVLEPFEPGGFGQVAFILADGAVVEYMQYTDLSHWFGQPNPPGWEPEPF